MRETPTWRIPIGVLALIAGLTIYGIAVAHYVGPLIGNWPGLAQAPVYVVLGIIWILPLGRFLSWMEIGKARPEIGEDADE